MTIPADDASGYPSPSPAPSPPGHADWTLLGEQDLHYFNEGTHVHMYRCLGAHPRTFKGVSGTVFGVWAPSAREVSVVGDFNKWDRDEHKMWARGNSGIWELFIPGVESGHKYKYFVRSHNQAYEAEKCDPYGMRFEVPPMTASVVHGLEDGYAWGDADWMRARGNRQRLQDPMAIYEVHLGSWRWNSLDGNRPLTYRELAEELPEYVTSLGFTHVEMLPPMEHPFGGSWGYQVTGFFAPTARFGTPEDFKYLIDKLHQAGVGVILDWVPGHFPTDGHALAYFDGTHLYEHADPRQGYHPDWNTYIFNYGRNEVRSFLLSNAVFWLDQYHADGLRIDGVASMLYLDYSRKEGEWIPNEYGGRENLPAISFLRDLNTAIYGEFPGVQTIAEESTAWPMVSRPTYVGGLGFGLKWDMGWMHDSLQYMGRESIHRRFHHNNMTFRQLYAWHENFVLPLSHDEVVHGKGSLLNKMSGDSWQQFANLRLLFAFMYGQSGKKMLFMGAEFAQRAEWTHDGSLDWHLLEHESHRGVHRLVGWLNHLYKAEPALHLLDCDQRGFQWIDANDADQSVFAFERRNPEHPEQTVVMVFNCTPVPREAYRVGVDASGTWEEILNTDAEVYWGSGMGNYGQVEASPLCWHGREHSLSITLPPLAAVWFRKTPVSGTTIEAPDPEA